MRTKQIGAVMLVMGVALFGCAGRQRPLQMQDGKGVTKEVVFPKGTFFGGVSQDQVGALAQMVADSNTSASQRLDMVERAAVKGVETTERVESQTQQIQVATREIQSSEKRLEEATRQIADDGKRLQDSTRKIGETTQKIAETTTRVEEIGRRIDETSQKGLETGVRTYDTTKMVLEAFEKVSKRQGTGELSIFFPVGSSRIEKGSLQYQRVVNFVDYLARESKGRKIMFISVGSASAFGPKALNERLAKERSQAPLDIIDQYLVNLPHEYVKIYGVGDTYSPKDVSRKEHERYQASRVIAFYEKGQEPSLPQEPAPREETPGSEGKNPESAPVSLR